MNSVESVEPIETIEERIEQLEFLAGNYEDRESLTKQLNDLEKVVDGMYGLSKPLQSLSEELTRQNLWQDVQDLDPQETNQENDLEEANEVDTELKKSVIASKIDGVSQTAQQLETVSTYSIPDTTSSRDLAILQTGIPKAEGKVKQAATISDELNVRSAQTSKEYLEKIVAETNRTWLDFEERMNDCEKALRKIELAAKTKDTRYETKSIEPADDKN